MESSDVSGVHLYSRNEIENVVGKSVPLDMVYPALIDTFGIILLGYVAGKFNFILDSEAGGLATFTGTFALPALIFGSLCKLNLMSVNWTFVLAIFITKASIFFCVLVVTYMLKGSRATGLAGLYAIFASQSNDFAVGYPILEAIYGDTNPTYPSYLYIMAPISLVMLNPVGFVFIEVWKNGAAGNDRQDRLKTVGIVARGVVTNPIMFMTVLGVAGNFAFGGQLPAFLDGFLESLGSAFTATALFLLGLRMANGSEKKSSASAVISTVVLIAVKTVAMPLIAREVISLLDAGSNATETASLASFGFIYGTFPTAPSVFVYAAKYNLAVDMVAKAMVACTFVSAPIMFVSAHLLSIKNVDPADYIGQLDSFLLNLSIVGLLACLWVVFVLVVPSKKWNRPPHCVTLSLTVSQAIACTGAITWSLINCGHGWKLYLQYSLLAFGVFASRINTAVLAVVLMVLKTRSTHHAARMKLWAWVAAFATPAFIVAVMMVVVAEETESHGPKADPNFQYGDTQAVVALVVLLACFFVTVVSMILGQVFSRENASRALQPASGNEEDDDDPTRRLLGDEPASRGQHGRAVDRIVAIEDIDTAAPCSDNCRPRDGAGRYRCDSEHREYCSSLLRSYSAPPAREAAELRDDIYDDDPQLSRHLILLVLLCISMFVGIALCVWTLVMDKMSGIYVELVFLDGFCNFGQGLLTFAVFGLDNRHVLVPLQSRLRRLVYGRDGLVLPAWDDLDEQTRLHCQQFLKHHVDACMGDIVRDVRIRLTVYRAAFRGRDLVDWLVEADLVRNRRDGVAYGRHLVRGRVVRHVDDGLDFYDDNFLYTFFPRDRAKTQ